MFTPCKYESGIDCATDYFSVPNPPHVTCRLCSVCTRYLKKSRNQFPFREVGYVQFGAVSSEIGVLEEVLYEVQAVRLLVIL